MFDINPGLPDELTEALHLHQVGAIALIIGIIIVVALTVNRARENFEGVHSIFENVSWVAGIGVALLGAFLLIA